MHTHTPSTAYVHTPVSKTTGVYVDLCAREVDCILWRNICLHGLQFRLWSSCTFISQLSGEIEQYRTRQRSGGTVNRSKTQRWSAAESLWCIKVRELIFIVNTEKTEKSRPWTWCHTWSWQLTSWSKHRTHRGKTGTCQLRPQDNNQYQWILYFIIIF